MAGFLNVRMANAFKCDGCGNMIEGSPTGEFQNNSVGSFSGGPVDEFCPDCTEEISQHIQRLDGDSIAGLGYGDSN